MLIQPGYFQNTYFSDYYWHGDWWPEYGLWVGRMQHTGFRIIGVSRLGHPLRRYGLY